MERTKFPSSKLSFQSEERRIPDESLHALCGYIIEYSDLNSEECPFFDRSLRQRSAGAVLIPRASPSHRTVACKELFALQGWGEKIGM